MKKFLLILLLIITLPLIGLFGFLKYADFNKFKPQIEELVLKYANIKAKINGNIKLGVSLKPSLEINNVILTNAKDNTALADVGGALIQLSIPPLLEKKIVIDTIQTANTKIFYNQEKYIEIKDLVLAMDSYENPINFSFDTNIENINIIGEGNTSSLAQIQASNFNDIAMNAKFMALQYKLDFEGDVKDLQKNISVSGKYVLDYQQNNIFGNVDFKLADKTPYLKLDAKSKKINIQDFLATKISHNSWIINNAEASEFIPNTKIPYDYLSLINADINLEIARLIVNNEIDLKNIKSVINLKNSVFKAIINNITAGDGTINGNIQVNGAQKNISTKLQGKNIILQNLDKSFTNADNKELYIKKGGKINFSINVNSKGADTNQILNNLNGQTIALVDESVLKITSLEELQDNIIVQILNKLNLKVTDKDINLYCAVVRGDITSGQINFPKGIAFNAKNLYVVADGKANLNNDKINFDIQPFSGKITDTNISSLVGSLIKVKGTINNPKLAINQTQTAKAVAGMLISGGTYNAGDLLLSADSSPCHTALKGTEYADYFSAETSIQSNVSTSYTETKDKVKELGKQAKGLLKNIIKDVKK